MRPVLRAGTDWKIRTEGHTMPKEPIPVHILTGFLGSGKTTVLNHLVRAPQFAKTFVIVNEFGEVGLDHLLAQSTGETMLEMSSGCICCTIRSDLRKTLKDISWRFSRMGKRQFDRVVIETTGLADPAPIIHTIMASPELAGDYELRSVIATIDGTCFAQTHREQCEARKQAAVADFLIMTKTDLVDERQRLRIEDIVRTVNPSAPLVASVKGVVDIDTLFATAPFSTLNKEADVEKWLDEEAYHDDHHDHHEHHHDVNRHGEDISAFCISRDDPVPERGFMVWIDMLLAFMGEKMLRIKGLVNIEGYDGPVVIHGVQHIFYPLYHMEQWPDSDRRTRIVFITKGIDKDSLETSLRSLTGRREERNDANGTNL
ncbi:MAG: GTP-binding protein [Spirochaetales bacterium]|nr:GTP-binding protein [Spirochaetales bacterium]